MPMNLAIGSGIGMHMSQTNRLEAEPVSFADFSANPATYEIGGESVVQTDYFWSEDGGLGGHYNADNHTATGIVWLTGDNYVAPLDPAVFAGLEAGFTGVIDATVPAGSLASLNAALVATFVPNFTVNIRTGLGDFTEANDSEATARIEDTISPGRHRFAFTYTSGHMALSFDGGEVFGADAPPETWAAIDEMTLTVGASLTPGDTILHHLALYEPQEDEALPILSAA